MLKTVSTPYRIASRLGFSFDSVYKLMHVYEELGIVMVIESKPLPGGRELRKYMLTKTGYELLDLVERLERNNRKQTITENPQY